MDNTLCRVTYAGDSADLYITNDKKNILNLCCNAIDDGDITHSPFQES